MLVPKLYATEWEIDRRLTPFDVKRGDLIRVVQQTIAARSDAIELDPPGTPGQLSYIYGSRHLRLLFQSRGWLIDQAENIASVLHPTLGTRIVFQNVDLACSPFRSPKAISGKGPAADRMIDAAQGRLFDDHELPEAVRSSTRSKLGKAAWYFCVSFNGDDVAAEMSLPASVKGQNFSGFIERIFIMRGGDWGGAPKLETDDGPVEALPTVVRR
jgi:hypothetical protein